MNWTLNEAIDICKEIEIISPKFGCHIGLTGGVLYKEGSRKDLDLILYRIRQTPVIAFEELFLEMEKIGIKKVSGFGFCIKAEYKDKKIDFLCPEEEGNSYQN